MMKHKGLSTYRLADNLLEQRFAEAWESIQHGNILDYLLSPTNRLEDTTTTERDKIVAATVIQWLGSPVGQTFLRDVLNVELPQSGRKDE